MRKDKIIGMFFGIGIGDALGMPVETYSAEQIKEKFGRVTDYENSKDHHWYKKFEIGRWTDDTQLTLAVARSLIEKGKIDLPNMIEHHLSELRACTKGWGKGTRESLLRVDSGIPWTESGSNTAMGNGIAMKISPIGAFLAAKNLNYSKVRGIYKDTVALTKVTHRTSIAAESAIAQIVAIFSCLVSPEADFEKNFFEAVIDGCKIGELLAREKITEDRLQSRLDFIWKNRLYERWTIQELASFCGGADSYVYNSLPFSYSVFLKNPNSIEALYGVVNAGGDTDSNGSIVGGLLGAFNGISIFPDRLIDGLWKKEEIRQVAEKFYDKFFKPE